MNGQLEMYFRVIFWSIVKHDKWIWNQHLHSDWILKAKKKMEFYILYIFQFQKTFHFSITYFVNLYLGRYVGCIFWYHVNLLRAWFFIFKEIDSKVFLIRWNEKKNIWDCWKNYHVFRGNHLSKLSTYSLHRKLMLGCSNVYVVVW